MNKKITENPNNGEKQNKTNCMENCNYTDRNKGDQTSKSEATQEGKSET